MVKRKIIRFWRGARRHSKPDLGPQVPNPRGKRGWLKPARRIGTRRWLVFGVIGFLLLTGPTLADFANGFVKPFEGCRIVGVVDGDTVKMICPKGGYQNGRVLGYDTPEFKGRCLYEKIMAVGAAFHLRWQLYRAEKIAAWPRGTDRYGRGLVFLTVDGRAVGDALIKAGLARGYAGGRRAGWCT